MPPPLRPRHFASAAERRQGRGRGGRPSDHSLLATRFNSDPEALDKAKIANSLMKYKKKLCSACTRSSMSLDPVNSRCYLRWGKVPQRLIEVVDATGKPVPFGDKCFYCVRTWEVSWASIN